MLDTDTHFMTEEGKDAYPIPTPLCAFVCQQYAVEIGRVRYVLQQIRFSELPAGKERGMPTCYAYEKSKGQMLLWPVPDKEYKVVLI